jgi:hypothetical protein
LSWNTTPRNDTIKNWRREREKQTETERHMRVKHVTCPQKYSGDHTHPSPPQPKNYVPHSLP